MSARWARLKLDWNKPSDAAFILGQWDGWWNRPAVFPEESTLADDYRSGWIAGRVAREHARSKREVA